MAEGGLSGTEDGWDTWLPGRKLAAIKRRGGLSSLAEPCDIEGHCCRCKHVRPHKNGLIMTREKKHRMS